jgi:hypothetical protein
MMSSCAEALVIEAIDPGALSILARDRFRRERRGLTADFVSASQC